MEIKYARNAAATVAAVAFRSKVNLVILINRSVMIRVKVLLGVVFLNGPSSFIATNLRSLAAGKNFMSF